MGLKLTREAKDAVAEVEKEIDADNAKACKKSSCKCDPCTCEPPCKCSDKEPTKSGQKDEETKKVEVEVKATEEQGAGDSKHEVGQVCKCNPCTCNPCNCGKKSDDQQEKVDAETSKNAQEQSSPSEASKAHEDEPKSADSERASDLKDLERQEESVHQPESTGDLAKAEEFVDMPQADQQVVSEN